MSFLFNLLKVNEQVKVNEQYIIMYLVPLKYSSTISGAYITTDRNNSTIAKVTIHHLMCNSQKTATLFYVNN